LIVHVFMKNLAKYLRLIFFMVFQAADLVRAGGTVIAWGYNYWGQTNVPAGLSNVTVISSEDATSLALSNGTVSEPDREIGARCAG
jgi:hypothetical protein